MQIHNKRENHRTYTAIIQCYGFVGYGNIIPSRCGTQETNQCWGIQMRLVQYGENMNHLFPAITILMPSLTPSSSPLFPGGLSNSRFLLNVTRFFIVVLVNRHPFRPFEIDSIEWIIHIMTEIKFLTFGPFAMDTSQ